MKLSQYMQYLKILQDRYGNIEVKIKTTHETTGEKDFYHSYRYTDVNKPKYDKNNKCVVIHKDYVSFD